jgi:hypothetical protein
MSQKQQNQTDKLKFQKKTIKDQADVIKEQEKRIAELIAQQENKNG